MTLKMLIAGLGSLVVMGSVHGEQATSLSLKHAMQGLLHSTTEITQGMFLNDFNRIAVAADHIADHPKPDLKFRKQIKQALGTDMSVFKQFDGVVHHNAKLIVQAAQHQDMTLVTKHYLIMIDGCQSCHSQFKQPLAAIFN